VDEINKARPDVTLISNSLQDGSFAGYSVLRAVQSTSLATRPVMLLEDCEQDLVIDAFRAGARGVFSRSEASEHLSKCIHSVHKRPDLGQHSRDGIHSWGAGNIASRFMSLMLVDATSCRSAKKKLSRWFADGLTNRQISEQLKLSEHTVKNYLFKVFEKTGYLHSRRARAVRSGPKIPGATRQSTRAYLVTDKTAISDVYRPWQDGSGSETLRIVDAAHLSRVTVFNRLFLRLGNGDRAPIIGRVVDSLSCLRSVF